jgi:hypothetical protein
MQAEPRTCEGRRPPGIEEECVEVALLLPAQQLEALERLASARGLTVGQLFRWLVWDYLGAPRREVFLPAGQRSEPGQPGGKDRWSRP